MSRYPLAIIITIVFIPLLFSCHEKKEKKHAEEAYDFKGNTITNVVFAENTDHNGKKENIDLDLYLPKDSGNGKKYPLTVFIHGGGFRVGEKEDGKVFCEMMADKGFAVASINYRTGWDKGKDPCSEDTSAVKVAVYRALQDTHAALRFLAANANKYSVDTNWVFISGSSAGGILSLATNYYPQDSANIFFGNMVDTLGSLNNYGNNLTTNCNIKGIAAMWGGLNSPFLVTKNNALPTIFFHGEKDNVVPYDVNYFYNCPNFYPCYGAKPLYNRLVSLGVPAEAYIDPNGGHGVYTAKFRAETTSGFFHDLIAKKPQTGFHTEPSDLVAAK